MEGYIDKTSPEYYVRKLQSDADLRNMDIKVLVALHVSLKSQPISYVWLSGCELLDNIAFIATRIHVALMNIRDARLFIGGSASLSRIAVNKFSPAHWQPSTIVRQGTICYHASISYTRDVALHNLRKTYRVS